VAGKRVHVLPYRCSGSCIATVFHVPAHVLLILVHTFIIQRHMQEMNPNSISHPRGWKTAALANGRDSQTCVSSVYILLLSSKLFHFLLNCKVCKLFYVVSSDSVLAYMLHGVIPSSLSANSIWCMNSRLVSYLINLPKLAWLISFPSFHGEGGR
jgi:hypothetical protein